MALHEQTKHVEIQRHSIRSTELNIWAYWRITIGYKQPIETNQNVVPIFLERRDHEKVVKTWNQT